MTYGYRTEAETAARSIVEIYENEIIERLINGEKASSDLSNDYENGDIDLYFAIGDREYDPKTAIDLLEELDKFSNAIDQRGLWQDVLASVAADAYKNAVTAIFDDFINKINEIDVETVRDDVKLEMLETEGTGEDENYDARDWERDNGDRIDAALKARLKEEIDEIEI